MKILYELDFDKYVKSLPTDALRLTLRRKLQYLENDPNHKSLDFKPIKLGKKQKEKIYQFRINRKWRVWGIRDGNTILLFKIFHK